VTLYSPVVPNLSEYFGQNSPLQDYLPGFQVRQGQSWMAEAVAQAIDESTQLVVEAGTGTGKTFAYLLPALLSDRKTIISTGTKALQDQLYHRDLPLLGKAVGRPLQTALLKGRSNYLCLHRLDTVADQLASAGLFEDLNAVREWRHRTTSGDRAELIEIAENSSVWPLVTSTADNCLGTECPLYKDCHVVRARRKAQEADLVVVNHHLLLADLAMKEEGFIEFLPGADTIILDEAHQIPDLAAQFFGVSLGSRELERLFEELRAATLPLKDAELQQCLDGAKKALLVLLAELPREEGRYEMSAAIQGMEFPLIDLSEALRILLLRIESVSQLTIELEKLCEQLGSVVERLPYLSNNENWDGLRWLEVNPRSMRLHLTPLDVADNLKRVMNSGSQAWVLTSATLAIGEDFSHFISRMGLSGAQALTFPSPYALESNALVWLPSGLPQPSDKSHTGALLETVLPIVSLTSGGVFLLFTSHRALNAAKRRMKSLKNLLNGRPLLAQGDAPRDDLLRRFRDYGNSVLLGTGSFWEGVDVRGQALTVVVIDKLPFASPADPLMMARLEYIRRQGENGFTGHQLPLAVLALKQGVGRLLRDETDYGVIVLGDPRVLDKSYGKFFLESLSPMQTTETLDDVEVFFKRHEVANTG